MEERSCWAKFHEFYLPHGLFNSYFYVDKVGKACKFFQCIYTSPLYQKKYAALGVEEKAKEEKELVWVELMRKTMLCSW
jgi:hypothetical protein